MSASTSLHLTLVNNDPTATNLVTPDGEALYSILTPSSSSFPSSSPSPSASAANAFLNSSPASPQHDGQSKSARPDDHQKGKQKKQEALQFNPRKTSSTTTIKRLERYHASIGHVETSIGVVEYRGQREGEGTRVKFCGEGNKPLDLEVGAKPNLKMLGHRGENLKDGDEELEMDEDDWAVDNSWEFTGPDNKHYRWQMVIQSPMLILAEPTTLTPLARYRRAKIGIVSRPRRAFLEILPPGVGIIDFIVVTFVAFMKQRVGIEDGPPGRKGDEEEEEVVVAELGGVGIPGVEAFKSGS